MLCKNCMGEGIIYFAVVSESITWFFFIISFSVFLHLPFCTVHSCTFVVMIGWASVCCVSFIVQPLHWLHQEIQWLLCSFCKNLHELVSNQKTLNAQKNYAFNDELSLWGKQLNELVFIWYHVWRNVQQMLLLWNITSFIYWELHVEMIPNKHLLFNCCWLEFWSWTLSAIATR